MKFILKFIGNIADRIFIFIIAIILLQTPLFISQYLNTLSGALFESEKTVKSIHKSAKKRNKTLEEFIQKHLKNSDKDFQASGRVMQKSYKRYMNYKTAFHEITKANIWLKPIKFISYFDYQLSKATKFTPGIPFQLEASVYAFIGILLGMSISGLFKKIFIKKNKQS